MLCEASFWSRVTDINKGAWNTAARIGKQEQDKARVATVNGGEWCELLSVTNF